jgi:hypothetical protein
MKIRLNTTDFSIACQKLLESGYEVMPPSLSMLEQGIALVTINRTLDSALFIHFYEIGIVARNGPDVLYTVPPSQVPFINRSIADRVNTCLASLYASVFCAQEGARQSTLSKAAFAAGGLVGSGQASYEHVSNYLKDAALKTGLEEDEVKATIKRGLRDGAQEPWQVEGGLRSFRQRQRAVQARKAQRK